MNRPNNGEILTFAFPNRSSWELGFTRLAEYLSKEIGVEVRCKIARDFDEVQDWVIHARAHIAVLTSTGYAQAKRLALGLQYIATAKVSEGGSPPVASYFGSIIVRKDSGYTRFEDIRGKTCAFVSTASSSGFKYPVVALEQEGIDYKTFFGTLMYLGDHPFVTDVIAAGIASSGATWEGNLAKAKAKHGDIFAEIKRYGPIPNHAIVVSHLVPSSLAETLASTLIAVPENVVTQPGFPYAGFKVLDDHAYEEAGKVEQLERRISGPISVRGLIPINDFRRAVLGGVIELISEVRISLYQKHSEGKFVKREPTPLLSFRTPSQLADDIIIQINSLSQAFPNETGTLPGRIVPLINSLIDSKFPDKDLPGLALRAFGELQALLPPQQKPPKAETSVMIEKNMAIADISTDTLDSLPSLSRSFREDVEAQQFIAATSALIQRRRWENSGRKPENRESQPTEERLALRIAYTLLEAGAWVCGFYQPLGISGFREIHTYLFNTDPGEGHITVSCTDLALMRGTAVHVEHIDRDKEFNKEKVEAYRLPAAINAAKVRLHIGTDAPTTAFIGRPVFESGTYRLDLLKSVHMTASACTAMFMNGIADCKIAIERMAVTESVEFMKSVVGNVIRDRAKQYLSAAFNINTPFLDDRPEVLRYNNGQPSRLTDRMDVARLGIAIARAAGFDKITWDGASNEVPSRPIIGLFDRPDRPGQLSHAQVCYLVHEAHENGLNAYVSAGLEPIHMRDAVLASLDGVGIGTSLHFIDPETKLMGALRAERIIEALRSRDDAERSPLGMAAILLARADRMFFEKTLPAQLDQVRRELFKAIVARDESGAKVASDGLAEIKALPSDGHPVVSHALRVIHSAESDSLLRSYLSPVHVQKLAGDLRRLITLGDLQNLAEVLTESTSLF